MPWTYLPPPPLIPIPDPSPILRGRPAIPPALVGAGAFRRRHPDLHRPAADRGAGHPLEHLVAELRGQLDEGEVVVDVDRADGLAGDSRLVGDRPHDVTRPHAGAAAGV